MLTAVKDLRCSAPFEYRDLVGLEDVRRCPHSFTPESSPLYHLQEDDGAVI